MDAREQPLQALSFRQRDMHDSSHTVRPKAYLHHVGDGHDVALLVGSDLERPDALLCNEELPPIL